jgi:hypothetical protein
MKTKLAVLLAAASLLSTTAFAHNHHAECDVSSDYDLRIDRDALVFTSKSASPARVELRHGELLLDGKAQALSAADRQRIAAYEDGVRRLVPVVLAIARDAVDIAFDAIEQVARAFAGDEHAVERSVAKFEKIRAEARERIAREFDSPAFDQKQFEKLVESTIASVVPDLAADVAAAAVKVALSGDGHAAAELEKRADRLGHEIEREVEARASKLEARVDALCPRLSELEQIESSLELKLADGRALDLYRVRR